MGWYVGCLIMACQLSTVVGEFQINIVLCFVLFNNNLQKKEEEEKHRNYAALYYMENYYQQIYCKTFINKLFKTMESLYFD